ncbi:S8 family serine peptidase [Streptomyces sp. 549]|uniref:S8 family serine peptidase n=1 Tax=Streptomyces sp. 549 TaxID=3049076 RepID=UPI0024C45EE0|nr:S8 family serine peptidase [Streptomyces sp. 549]MDK1476952.1 S8 family serine peptidase [Streptomyces sp. 549]
MARAIVVLLAATVGLSGLTTPARAAGVQDDQWYLEPMQAEQMWKVSKGKGITVAVVDSGVSPSSSTLRGRVLPGTDVSGTPGGPHDDVAGHGTTMAELIAGTGSGGGILGLAPEAQILPVRTLSPSDPGHKKHDTIAGALRAAADSEAQIINLSLGGVRSPDLERAVDYAAAKGKLMFASTGNSGNDESYDEGWIEAPASYDSVVAVAGADNGGETAEYSQKGRVALTAPGTNIPGWCDKSLTRYCRTQGTSNSTAIASASAALIWAKHPEWTANQVLRVMLQTAGVPKGQKVPSEYVGYGAVRPRKVLLEGKGDPGDPDVHPLIDPSSIHPSPSPKPQPSEEPDPGPGAAEPQAAGKAADDSPGQTVLLAGGGAAAVLLAAAVFAFVRLRRGRQ